MFCLLRDSSVFCVCVLLLSFSMFCMLFFVMFVFSLLFILIFTCLSDCSFVSFCTTLLHLLCYSFFQLVVDCLFEFANLKLGCLFRPVYFVLSHFRCFVVGDKLKSAKEDSKKMTISLRLFQRCFNIRIVIIML